MIKNAYCFVCLSLNRRTINIYKTDLQYVYENLANYEVKGDECWMCYICHTRLRQCHQLQQLAVQTRGLIDDMFQKKDKINGCFKSILELSTSQTKITSTTHSCLHIKQETAWDAGVYIDDGIKQEEIIENKNYYDDNVEVKRELTVEVGDAIAGFTQELLNVDNVDAQQKAMVPELATEKPSQSVIDKHVLHNFTTHPATEIHLEDRREEPFGERSMEHQEIKQEVEDKGIKHEEILEYKNYYDDKFEVKGEPFGEFGDAFVSNTQKLLNVDKIDVQQKATFPKLTIDKPIQSFIDKYVRQSPTIHPLAEIYPEDRRGETFGVQSAGHPEIRPGIEDRGRQGIEQGNTYGCEGVDRANEARSVCRKKLSCDVCLKKFAFKSKLFRHMRTHTGEKPYSCDVCSKKFTQNISLSLHILIHTDIKPFCCDVCSKKYHRKCDLNKHKQTHLGTKPFCCDRCPKKFQFEKDLNKHKLIHTGIKKFCCDVCSKKFLFKGDLYKHQLIHTDSRAFSCDICSRKFRLNGALTEHRRIHTGETPYSCDVCSERFRRKRNLNKHKLIHTSGKPQPTTLL